MGDYQFDDLKIISQGLRKNNAEAKGINAFVDINTVVNRWWITISVGTEITWY